MKVVLNNSGVEFNSKTHQYFLRGKELTGITTMLKYQIFPNKYKGIPRSILDAAATRGSEIHAACEYYDNFGAVNDKYREVGDYARITKDLQYEISEYYVTDGEHIASALDKVYRVSDNEFIIADIKTTAELDEEYVTWQTSIYEYLFLKLNPMARVVRRIAIWLPKKGEPQIVDLERISDANIERLIDVEFSDGKFYDGSIRRSERENASTLPAKQDDAIIPEKVAKMQQYVFDTLLEYEAAKRKREEMCSKVQEAMMAYGITKWKTDNFSFSQSKDTTRKTFNLAAAKKKYPEINWDDEDLYRVSEVSGSFKVTFQE